jgi:hypothetical protein
MPFTKIQITKEMVATISSSAIIIDMKEASLQGCSTAYAFEVICVLCILKAIFHL